MSTRADHYEQVHVETREQLRAWLETHHRDTPGAWLVSWKAATNRPACGYDAVVEEALCFGWVDSRPRTLDRERAMLLLTPRNPTSRWSRLNKQRVERLIAEGRMTRAGLAVVEAAKRNGAWTALDHVEALIVPEDLSRAFDANPGAREHWEAFPRSAKRAILEWIAAARRPETRAARVRDTAEKAAVGERANQWRRPERA